VAALEKIFVENFTTDINVAADLTPTKTILFEIPDRAKECRWRGRSFV
jgi:hypothetical protein